ncbi:hypothetical protein PRIPAC_97764 [Pristionchus pacificus]|uniref:Uncharacterized protein n=1 Tax=Pristionchus pacificus TaxID=54126 RepID=A0A2A6BIV2_PRIPA|nr:hypothetical protein PRIPAC_97764 [Pristionchus pacificus]|eukprot:PDM65817.1 hypothetical protein PRIPAC_45218 [Pristionchus pacificus]
MYCKIVLFVCFFARGIRADEIGNTSEALEVKGEAKHDGTISFMGNYGRSSRKEDNTTIEKEWQIALAGDPEETLFVAGLPDNSDECFSRFTNVIVVDADPYTHSNGTSLPECKQQCIKQQQQFEACASFVYDNAKQECDIFTQRGDVAPSWLRDFQSRDYFEPNFGVGCNIQHRLQTMTSTFRRDSQKQTPFFVFEFNVDDKSVTKNIYFEHLAPQSATTEAVRGCTKCENGKVTRFTRIEGYELFESNDEIIEGATAEECIEQCDADKIGESPLACRSFEFIQAFLPYMQGACAFSSEQAFPVGNGRLKRNKDAEYYEKLCVDERLARNCDKVFDRFPQMVLVAYAETVTDAPNFETCIERCINSFDVYGYNCTSGMYYFEEKQLNCILNAESRWTKEALFADEFEEVVDYFEISCGARRKTGRD